MGVGLAAHPRFPPACLCSGFLLSRDAGQAPCCSKSCWGLGQKIHSWRLSVGFGSYLSHLGAFKWKKKKSRRKKKNPGPVPPPQSPPLAMASRWDRAQHLPGA